MLPYEHGLLSVHRVTQGTRDDILAPCLLLSELFRIVARFAAFGIAAASCLIALGLDFNGQIRQVQFEKDLLGTAERSVSRQVLPESEFSEGALLRVLRVQWL
jgi:hypothetical protein